MFSCFVTSSVEIYCHRYAITMILATAEFLGGEQKRTRQKCMCLKGMSRVWYQNVCITNFSRLTLKFKNSFKVFWHMQSLKKLEKIGVLSHILHRNARLQCERCFALALRLSHGFLGMWSLPIGKKTKVKGGWVKFLLCSPWIEITSHQCKVCVEKQCLNGSPRNSAFINCYTFRENWPACSLLMNERKSFPKCWLWFYTACANILKENLRNAPTANNRTIPPLCYSVEEVRVIF